VTIANQPELTNDELRMLLDPYRSQYSAGYDDVLRHLTGKCCFDREDLDVVAEWKFSGWRQRLQRTATLWNETPTAISKT